MNDITLGEYKTRGGEVVRVICTDRKSEIGACVVGMILRGATEFTYYWQLKGCMRFDGETNMDLINKI